MILRLNYICPLLSVNNPGCYFTGKSLGHGEVNALFPSDSRTFGVYGKYGGGKC